MGIPVAAVASVFVQLFFSLACLMRVAESAGAAVARRAAMGALAAARTLAAVDTPAAMGTLAPVGTLAAMGASAVMAALATVDTAVPEAVVTLRSSWPWRARSRFS